MVKQERSALRLETQNLFDGIDFLVIALGLFALAEVTSSNYYT